MKIPVGKRLLALVLAIVLSVLVFKDMGPRSLKYEVQMNHKLSNSKAQLDTAVRQVSLFHLTCMWSMEKFIKNIVGLVLIE